MSGTWTLALDLEAIRLCGRLLWRKRDTDRDGRFMLRWVYTRRRKSEKMPSPQAIWTRLARDATYRRAATTGEEEGERTMGD